MCGAKADRQCQTEQNNLTCAARHARDPGFGHAKFDHPQNDQMPQVKRIADRTQPLHGCCAQGRAEQPVAFGNSSDTQGHRHKCSNSQRPMVTPCPPGHVWKKRCFVCRQRVPQSQERHQPEQRPPGQPPQHATICQPLGDQNACNKEQGPGVKHDDRQSDQDNRPDQVSPQIEPAGQIDKAQGIERELIADGPGDPIQHRYWPDRPERQKIANQFQPKQPQRGKLFGNPIFALVDAHWQENDECDPEDRKYPGCPVHDEIQRGFGPCQYRLHGDKDYKPADRKE